MFRKIPEILDQSLPTFSRANLPEYLKTRTEWKRTHRKVRKGEQPLARLGWQQMECHDTECHHPDGTVTPTTLKVPVVKECGLYSADQTAPYRPTRRTLAIDLFRHYFVQHSSRDKFIWWNEGRWKSCDGPLQQWNLKKHLNADERPAVSVAGSGPDSWLWTLTCTTAILLFSSTSFGSCWTNFTARTAGTSRWPRREREASTLSDVFRSLGRFRSSGGIGAPSTRTGPPPP